MAHYAKVVNGIVETVIVAETEFFDTFVDDSPGKWVQTSYNTRAGEHRLGGTPLRKNYAGIGFHYDGLVFMNLSLFQVGHLIQLLINGNVQ